MGVHDYTCSVCGTPGRWECHEADGGACVQQGIGEDTARVELFFFDEADAPEDSEGFSAARGKALRTLSRTFAYDWGDWEFEPSLNYRTLLMDDDDPTGVWFVKAFEEHDDGSPVSVEVPEGQQLWAVNYCPRCHEAFAAARPLDAGALCRRYLEEIATHLQLEFHGDKAAFAKAVRENVATRRPVR